METDYEWKKGIKVMLYCQIGKAVDLADFAIDSALRNSGMPEKDFDIFFITWKSSPGVYEWLKKKGFKYVEMKYDEGKGFLWNLYKGWNMGYEVGYKYADTIVPIATDHAFYAGWLANLYKHRKENRIVNCKLIEPGTIPTLHTAINFGITRNGDFKHNQFEEWCKNFIKDNQNKLLFDDCIPALKGGSYGHRLDAMPFLVPKDVWDRFGPMSKTFTTTNRLPGDVDFFNRCSAGGVDITKSLDAISYHCGGLETQRNKKGGVYT